jgi:hypothetical protein
MIQKTLSDLLCFEIRKSGSEEAIASPPFEPIPDVNRTIKLAAGTYPERMALKSAVF